MNVIDDPETVQFHHMRVDNNDITVISAVTASNYINIRTCCITCITATMQHRIFKSYYQFKSYIF